MDHAAAPWRSNTTRCPSTPARIPATYQGSRPSSSTNWRLKTLYDVLVTDHTRADFTKRMEDAFDRLKEEQPSVTVDGPPTDAQIRELLEDPQAFLQHEFMGDVRYALCEAMNRIEIHGQTATVHYAMPLPKGSPLAGQTRQTVELSPDLVVA